MCDYSIYIPENGHIQIDSSTALNFLIWASPYIGLHEGPGHPMPTFT